jgi:hypothetical protein
MLVLIPLLVLGGCAGRSAPDEPALGEGEACRVQEVRDGAVRGLALRNCWLPGATNPYQAVRVSLHWSERDADRFTLDATFSELRRPVPISALALVVDGVEHPLRLESVRPGSRSSGPVARPLRRVWSFSGPVAVLDAFSAGERVAIRVDTALPSRESVRADAAVLGQDRTLVGSARQLLARIRGAA